MTLVPHSRRSAMPTISVIVPVYNVRDHVAAAIASLRAQTFADFEALVIDDGSTDGSGAVAQQAMGDDTRFRLIRQDNRGLSGARNTGLDQAQGTFIAFLDSDDRFAPDYLDRLLGALNETGADWVACAVRSCFADGTSHVHSAIHGAADLGAHPVPRRYALSDWSDVIRHFPSAWNKLYRRSLIDGLRFDEGTWFEDHTFFLSAAARTDHILHLPEPLYLQTRGRAGQITASDDERVFEQFPVLRDMRQRMTVGGKTGMDEGFARIATRLVFERSTALRDPERRARFARRAADFFAEESIRFSPDWDADIARAWGLEMQGEHLLSLVLPWDGNVPEALRDTLDSLANLSGPGREVLLCCPAYHQETAGELAGTCPGTRVLTSRSAAPGALLTLGRKAAQGRFIQFLIPGDLLHPAACQDMVELMLATGADHGLCQFRKGTGTDAVPHNGFEDMTCFPGGTPPSGALEITPYMALSMAPDLSTRMFSRDFLNSRAPAFTDSAHPDWALGLAAPVLATETAYLGWGPLALDTSPGSYRARSLPQSARALARSHDATCRALPKEVSDVLPEGWQRRLFARALRQKVSHGRPRAGFLAGAMLAAVARGLTGARVAPAGFDPSFGPGLARLLNPAGLLGRAPLLPHGRAKESTGSPLRHAFPLLGARGLFRFRADFHGDPYANLSFIAEDGLHIPFHLSLRRDEKLAVINDTRLDGAWRAERPTPMELPRDGVEVVVEIAPPRVCVTLDGVELRHPGSGKLWRRGKYTGLERITWLETEGGIRPLDMMTEPPGPALRLDPRLQLRATGAAEAQLLRIGHTKARLHCTPAASIAGDMSFVADLPGRHWRGVPEADPLKVTDGKGRVQLSLTRSEMAARIEGLMSHPPGPGDSALALNLLDHVRHGELQRYLSARARRALHRLAGQAGLQDYIEDPTESPVSPPPQVQDHDDALVDAALARFHQSQQSTAAPDPLKILDELTPPGPARRIFYLALTDVFCRAGQDFEGYFDLTHAYVLDGSDLAQDGWSQSALLPYLLKSGRHDDAQTVLAALAQPREDWLLTPPLAWALRFVTASPDLDPARRTSLLDGLIGVLRALARDYWGRAHCIELTRTAAQVAAGPQHGTALATACVEVYGLSRRFWDEISSCAGRLPPSLRAAQQSFQRLTAPNASAEAIETALRLFERANCSDAARVRRDLLGPAGSTDPQKAAPGEALRLLASPDGTTDEASLSDLASAAISELYLDDLADARDPESLSEPPPPEDAVQIAASRAVQAVLAHPGDTADLPGLQSALEPICDAGAGFLGIGLALTAATSMCASQARDMHDWIATCWRALSDKDRARAEHAPAIQAALARSDAAGMPRPAAFADLDLPALPRDDTRLSTGSPLFDTLVVVFSCKPNLDTRIPALRNGWLSLLDALNVRYVIVVGDGDGRLEGDILHLDAPDDYEGLPQKTLAAIRWVHDHTGFAHLLKVDDDCFLNAPLFFETLAYRRYDYYGRRLVRGIGQTDRRWHQAKSTSERGRYELDRSPEPSFYADGGSGYALSRRAMRAALEAAARPAGQRLIDLSFMEDKMLGDLLALSGIYVRDAGYRVTIRRRTHAGAIPVSAWLNSFFPSQSAPVHLIHLDTHEDQPTALERLASPGLWPKKIWPSFQNAKLGYQSNTLDLISSPESAARARDAEVAVVAVMRNEMFMLPHFLSHYRRLGADSFLIADNGSDDGTREYLAEQPDVTLFSVDTDYNRSHYGVAWQQAMLSAFRVGKWSLVADADELLVWQDRPRETLRELLARPEFTDAEAARVFMLDMYPDGPLEAATFASGDPFAEAGFCDAVPFLANTPMRGPYSDAPAWTSALRHRLIPGARATLFVAQKLALLRYHPFMRLSDGLHFVSDARIAERELVFGHFKYNAAFREKARAETARGQHWGNAEEYRKYLALASEGRSVIYDPSLSVQWWKSAFVRARLD
ncbi:glycosyltransferase [Primorskyibacter aestuariivivens]|uniref:glycosyltransferase n=1 Tax=Primorskyibacter aestuariivivens TaxID=1888912 RepID=UPI0022FFF904|nr:glycosyltransferase [Primorskyibacter aestuariivivens]MDA7429586.1 glycosyltransferase [Primorskyibacter aestuariivivens]